MIPIILGAVALGTAVFGVGAGISGVTSMNEANEIGQRAKKHHEDAVNQLQIDWNATNDLAQEYGQLQIDVIVRTIGRFIDFIERKVGKAKQSEKEFSEGLEGISVQQLDEYKSATMQAEHYFVGGAKAVGALTAGYGGAMSLATSVGVASTGTAISGLSGAAAWNATLAWLGGGSLAAGGGGMALGSLVLGGITIGPAVLISGFVLAGEGEKALTNARKYEADVNIAIAQIDAAKDFLQQVRQRISELKGLIELLNDRAVLSLNELDSLASFDRNNDKDIEKFRQVGLFISTLAEIMKIPILDEQGQLNPVTATIRAKYSIISGN